MWSAEVRPTFSTEPEPNVRLSSMENSSGSRTVLLSLLWPQWWPQEGQKLNNRTWYKKLVKEEQFGNPNYFPLS